MRAMLTELFTEVHSSDLHIFLQLEGIFLEVLSLVFSQGLIFFFKYHFTHSTFEWSISYVRP